MSNGFKLNNKGSIMRVRSQAKWLIAENELMHFIIEWKDVEDRKCVISRNSLKTIIIVIVHLPVWSWLLTFVQWTDCLEVFSIKYNCMRALVQKVISG